MRCSGQLGPRSELKRMDFRPNDTAKHRLKAAALLLAVLAAGACVTWGIVSRADREMRAGLLQETQMVAQAVDAERLQALSGTEADLASPAYQRLKDQLVTARSTNPLCRFIYLLGRNPDGTLFFFVDSEPPSSKDYSPPGQTFDEAVAGIHRAFTTRSEIVEGPYTDRWGNWVSALVPIFEPKAFPDKDKGKVLAVFGMDIGARDWIWMLVFSGVPPVLLTLALTLILLAGSMLLELRSWSDARPPRQIRNVGLALVAAVGVVMTLFAAWMCHDRETHDRDEAFRRLAVSRTAAIAETLHKLRDTELEGLAHFCQTNPTATPEEFNHYTAYLTKNPAIQAWEWIPAVAAADRLRFEEEARAAGWKGFEIWQKDMQGKRGPVTARDVYYPVFQVAPLAGNERAVGYDTGSEPLRRAALEEAACTGLATGTDPITLVQETGDQKGMLVYRPVFSGKNPKRLLGFAMAVLRMGTLLGVEDSTPPLPMQLSLLRKDAVPELLASAGDTGGLLLARPSVKRPVFAFGKVFAATIYSERELMVLWHHPGQASLLALLIGLLLTSALAILVGVLLRRREELERLVTEMTKNQLIARHARDPLLLMTLEGRIMECNHAAEKLYGYSRAELLRLRIGDLRAQESPESVRRQMQQAQKQGLLFETTHVCKSGAVVPVEVNSQSILFEGQEMLLSVIRDITERKRDEAALRDAEALGVSMRDSLLEHIAVLDAQGVIIAVNRAWKRFARENCAPEHVADSIGLNYLQICEPSPGSRSDDDSAEAREGIVAVLNGTLSEFEMEYPCHSPTEQRWFQMRVLPLQGSKKGVVVAHLDITQRKLAQGALRKAHLELEERVKKRTEELNQSKDQLQLLLDSTAEAIYGIDTRGECTFCNSACLRMLGYEREEELLGKNMHWQIHHKHADGTDFPVEECRIFRAFQVNEGSHVDNEVIWRTDGTSFPAEYWSYPQRVDGVAVGAVVTFVDITERKRAEGVVLQNLARTEELARLKSRFVSMASHELRTPLANIMLDCDLLKNFRNAMPPDRSQSVLSGLMSGVTSMVRTLDDLLLAGKLEEGKLPCTPARFALPDFLKRCCQDVQPDLKLPSRIEIGLRDAGLRVTADARLLGYILKNLLENALKYSSDDTKIELGVEVGPDSLTLSVRDCGIGVPEADRSFLFDAFSRASNVGDKPGSGLGLFVAQKCAQAHGGQVRYTPLLDGSVFSVTIPLATTGLDPVI